MTEFKKYVFFDIEKNRREPSWNVIFLTLDYPGLQYWLPRSE